MVRDHPTLSKLTLDQCEIANGEMNKALFDEGILKSKTLICVHLSHWPDDATRHACHTHLCTNNFALKIALMKEAYRREGCPTDPLVITARQLYALEGVGATSDDSNAHSEEVV